MAVSTTTQFIPEQGFQSFSELMNFLQNPLAGASPVIQTVLSELVPSEETAVRTLEDMFRRAGALKSGAFAQAGRQLAGDILRQRSQAAIKAGLAFLSPLISARVQALEATFRPLTERIEEALGGTSISGFPIGSAAENLARHQAMRAMQDQISRSTNLGANLLDVLRRSEVEDLIARQSREADRLLQQIASPSSFGVTGGIGGSFAPSLGLVPGEALFFPGEGTFELMPLSPPEMGIDLFDIF